MSSGQFYLNQIGLDFDTMIGNWQTDIGLIKSILPNNNTDVVR